MAAKKKRPLTDEETKEMWVCEGCGDAHFGVNPPNRCKGCGHTYFENMYDILGIKDESTSH